MAGTAALEDRYLVIDAPASGSAIELLSVSSGVKGIAPAGTLNRLADSIDGFLSDATRFGVVITMTPEDLAVREALETAATIRDRLGIATVAAIMNCVPDLLFDTSELAAHEPVRRHTRDSQFAATPRTNRRPSPRRASRTPACRPSISQ